MAFWEKWWFHKCILKFLADLYYMKYLDNKASSKRNIFYRYISVIHISSLKKSFRVWLSLGIKPLHFLKAIVFRFKLYNWSQFYISANCVSQEKNKSTALKEICAWKEATATTAGLHYRTTKLPTIFPLTLLAASRKFLKNRRPNKGEIEGRITISVTV